MALISLCMLLCGCSDVGTQRAEPLKYQSMPFKAEISGELNGVEFEALIEHFDVNAEDGAKLFCVRIEYTAPLALSGIVLTRDADGIVLNYDGTEISDDGLHVLMRPAELFEISESVVSVKETVAADGRRVLTYLLSDGSSVRLDPESGYPVEIDRSDMHCTCTVVWFEPCR